MQDTEVLFTQGDEKIVVVSMVAVTDESNDEDLTVDVEDGE